MTKKGTSSNRFTRHRSAAVVMLAFVLSGVVLAACGGGSASSTSTKTTTTTLSKPSSSSSSSTASNTAFTNCLKQHGVTSPGFGGGKPPTGSPGGTKPAGGSAISSTTRAAIQACASLRPAGSGFGGGAGGPGGAGGATNATAFAAYRNCMTLHGVTLPTPGKGTAPSASSTVTTSAKYKTAFAACSSLMPARTTTTTAPSA